MSEQTISWTEQQQTQTPELLDAQQRYVTELNNLSEILSKVSAQSERLARDSEEIDNLNRTITGITKVYEMQLKSASKQMSTIDDINEQSAKMASQIEQLNKIYTRMIEAMTVNMRASGAPTIDNIAIHKHYLYNRYGNKEKTSISSPEDDQSFVCRFNGNASPQRIN